MRRIFILISLSFLSSCASDKKAHFFAGAITSKYIYDQTDSKLLACAGALGIGVAKEYIDSKGYGTPETMDAVATVAGCSIVQIEF